ncbi:class I SAM-dependent methyltransferase [Lottiidibacillus patelloidae]|uniref:class I SAM-dependent methyltransferase n=1 Tax=Lottiidibacillus patelloidae TaxID=2670334 RepID=UPI001303B657|nr:class I SAM-dependent methyltransferase [Lottiidibacillus patelloidae]
MEEQLKNQLKESYNKVAKIRDKSPIQQWKINEMNLFVNELADLGQTKLLDLGAGPGLQSLYFQQLNIQVTAIDLSSEMVRLCKEKGISAHEMDLSNLQFENGTFDAVWSMNSLLHVPKKSLRPILKT